MKRRTTEKKPEPKHGLLEVSFDKVAPFASRCAKENVCIKPTKGTRWFSIGSGVGFCGIIKVTGNKWRLKAVYLFPEWRGLGLGKTMCAKSMEVMKAEGADLIEVITVRPDFFGSLGFKPMVELRPGHWRMECKLAS